MKRLLSLKLSRLGLGLVWERELFRKSVPQQGECLSCPIEWLARVREHRFIPAIFRGAESASKQQCFALLRSLNSIQISQSNPVSLSRESFHLYFSFISLVFRWNYFNLSFGFFTQNCCLEKSIDRTEQQLKRARIKETWIKSNDFCSVSPLLCNSTMEIVMK